MRLSLTIKWILTLLLSSLIGVALVGFFAYWTTSREFDRFRSEVTEQDFIDNVVRYYEIQNSWYGINDYLHESRFDEYEPDDFQELSFAIASADGLVLSEAGHFKVGDRLSTDIMDSSISITLNGLIIGYALNAEPPGLSPHEREYLENTNRALIVGVIGASAVAVLVGILLSRQFLYPLSELTQAIAAMKSGELDQQVTVHTHDELGQLAQTFNQMSAEIHRANQLRQQMTADIAHDLRTPLQVITGYIEAMRDGVLAPSAERFDAMNHEAGLLKRLVDDLRTLSLADAKKLKLIYEDIAPHELLEHIKDMFQAIAEEQAVKIVVEADRSLPLLQIDRARMLQVLTNLISNALRYTAAGGQITLVAEAGDDAVQLIVRDTGSGIPADKLANIFERFYRVDESRHEVDGESGLGLAIVKSIVQAHEGNVTVASQPGKGTSFTITLAKPDKATH